MDIIIVISSMYAISCLIDNIIESPKQIKSVKLNKQKYLIAYNLIDNITKENKINLNSNNINYPKELKEIITKFIQYTDEENLDCLQKVQNVKINYIKITKDFKKYLQNFSKEGTYNIQNNTINIYKLLNKKSVLSHEFLHLISSNNNISGFTTIIDDILIGDGLDEGYTEFLNQKIFKIKKTAYPYNVKLIKKLEQIFENPKEIENAYFHNDFLKLYHTFLKYGTKEEFFHLIQTLDNLIDTDNTIYQKIIYTKEKNNLNKIIQRNKQKIKEL